MVTLVSSLRKWKEGFMANIRTSHEKKRGCGYRKGGGYYLIGGDAFSHCGKLPYLLKPCEHCGMGLKFHRGFGWFNPREFIESGPCENDSVHSQGPGASHDCDACSMGFAIPERAGIMWVGNKFYTPESFLEESLKMGLSKRLPTIPRELLQNMGFVRVYLAHPKACIGVDGKPAPGIFSSFVPNKIEYVVKGTESEQELGRIENRGVGLVKVVPVEDQAEPPQYTSLKDVLDKHDSSL
jgi:hypothetical protein